MKPAELVNVVLAPDVDVVCTTDAGVGEGLLLLEVHPAVTTASVISAAITRAAVIFRRCMYINSRVYENLLADKGFASMLAFLSAFNRRPLFYRFLYMPTKFVGIVLLTYCRNTPALVLLRASNASAVTRLMSQILPFAMKVQQITHVASSQHIIVSPINLYSKRT